MKKTRDEYGVSVLRFFAGVYLDKNVYKLLILGFLILFNFFVGQIFFSFLETAVAVILILISISTSIYLVVHLSLKK